MRRLFWHWAISAITLVIAVAAAPGIVFARSWLDAIWLAPLLGLVNLAVGVVTAILKLFFGLANLLTLGLLGFIISFVLYGTAIYWLGRPKGPMSDIISVPSWIDAVMLAAIMALVSIVLNMILPGKRGRK